MTAVEFLHSEYMKIFGELNPSTGKLYEIAYALEQAKEMEKEQMEITWNNAIDAQLKDKWDSYDDFHKTTFKSE